MSADTAAVDDLPAEPISGAANRSGVAREENSEPPERSGGSMAAAPVWWLLGAVAALRLAVQLFALEGYGYFRDELYYLSCADHLGWGYVDHPPLSIAVLWLVRSLFGESLWAIRWLPALAGAVTVALVGWIAARLGGGLLAQALAMVAFLTPPVYWALNHFYSMNAISLLVWTAASALVVHLLDGGHRRGWLWLGVLLGLGLLNKLDVLWWGAGLGLGLIVAGRRFLSTRGPWLAGLISMLILAPYGIWQLVHGWPTLEFMRNASANKMQSVTTVEYLAAQIDMMQPITLPLCIAGLGFLLLAPTARKVRAAGWVFPMVLLILMANGTSRTGYLAGAYPLLFAAGSVAVTSFASRWRKMTSIVTAFYIASLLAYGALVLPFGLPILSVEAYLQHASLLGVTPSTEERKEVGLLPQHYADMFGWRELAVEVSAVADTLTVEQRQRAAIFVGNYGQAGALRLFGRAYDLPPVLSGHNSHWMWGEELIRTSGADGSVMILIGGRETSHRESFAEVRLVGRTRCDGCMPYENGVPIFIATEPKVDIASLWAEAKHYD